MRQILQSYRSGELWLAEVPTPACRPGGVLVRTRRSVVSAGTERMLSSLARKSLIGKARARPDLVKKVLARVKTEGLRATLDKVHAKLDEPVALGYSAMGTVVEVGRGTGDLVPGERVALAGAGYATHAEFNYVPRNLCARVPDGVSDTDAAFATVGAIALQGVRQADPRLGERVVVIGLGLLGQLTVQILKANGCAVLGVDLDAERAELARAQGADLAVAGDADVDAACAAFTGGRGADAVIVTAATPSNGPIESAARVSRHKGRVVVVGFVGMNVPRDAFYAKELDLRLSTSYGPGRYDPAYEEGGRDYPFAYVRFTEQRNLESFLYLVDQGRVTPAKLITHRVAFADALEAYGLLDADPTAEGTSAPLGIVLEYTEDVPLAPTLRRDADPRATGSGRGELGIAVVGAGSFAKGVLLPALNKFDGLRREAVCTSTGKSAQQAAERFGFAAATTDADELFAADGVDAVFIATPHASHASLACAALRAGKHVFVEKPLALSSEELEACVEALDTARARGHEPCLTVGFNRRFSRHARALADGFAGRGTPMVVSYRVNAGRIPPEHWIQDPQVGGGRILGEVCHFVDFCGFLTGSVPVRVTATSIASERRDVVAHDSVVITIQYDDGSLAVVQYFAEGDAALPKERCEVYADARCAVMDDFKTTEFFGGGGKLKGAQDKGHAGELAAFLDSCRDGGDWPISWSSLLATHRVCLAALTSLATGAPVGVNERR
ncbi:MAG: Gfo/Idh/MocA family oxidoreductase [bacterium]|nr:Gfo/Idh/MocA family oxidoreductase [bacterium]